MKYLLLVLPLCACGPHVESCLTVPQPIGCTEYRGGGSSLAFRTSPVQSATPRPPAVGPDSPGGGHNPGHDDGHKDHDEDDNDDDYYEKEDDDWRHGYDDEDEDEDEHDDHDDEDDDD